MGAPSLPTAPSPAVSADLVAALFEAASTSPQAFSALRHRLLASAIAAANDPERIRPLQLDIDCARLSSSHADRLRYLADQLQARVERLHAISARLDALL